MKMKKFRTIPPTNLIAIHWNGSMKCNIINLLHESVDMSLCVLQIYLHLNWCSTCQLQCGPQSPSALLLNGDIFIIRSWLRTEIEWLLNAAVALYQDQLRDKIWDDKPTHAIPRQMISSQTDIGMRLSACLVSFAAPSRTGDPQLGQLSICCKEPTARASH